MYTCQSKFRISGEGLVTQVERFSEHFKNYSAIRIFQQKKKDRRVSRISRLERKKKQRRPMKHSRYFCHLFSLNLKYELPPVVISFLSLFAFERDFEER